MILKSLELTNFRKFREPLQVDAFSEGLNIVVEPNETGKSTLLEALRAALFIRHSAKTELVRSYVPIGDDVAPRVSVAFDLDAQTWTLEKQFLKSPFVRLTGGGRRWESDAAEEALQELLGFERGNNRGSDPEARGPLGMLWVEQASALSIESPNRIVRDTVRGVLEAEVGAVTGGRRFDAIRANIEAAYSALRTPATGKSRGDLAAMETRVSTATTERQAAEGVFREYEQMLSELDDAKSRLKILERDLADPETAERRKKLQEDQKVAETAALRLTAAEAQFGHAEAIADTAASRLEKLEAAETRAATAATELESKQRARDDAKSACDVAAEEERSLRATLDSARRGRQSHEDALTGARERARAFADAAGARRALEAHKALSALEDRERVLIADTAATIDDDVLENVAELERAAIQARIRFEAGAVKVEVELAKGASLRINGTTTRASNIDVLTATKFEIGEAGTLTIHPPKGSGRSLDADLGAATEELASALRWLGIDSHSAGVARNERASAAGRELTALRAQIAAGCPGDPTIGLAPGADALRAFVATLDQNAPEAVAPPEDLTVLEKAAAEAKLAETAALAKHENARAALSKAENTLTTAEAELAAAVRESKTAGEDLRLVATNGNRSALEKALADAQRDRTAKFEFLEAARERASAFDLDAIRRRMENLDRAATRAGEERIELTARIASLESTILKEGTAGPAGRLAAAREEERAANEACERLRCEADTLEMLRKVLTEAADEASRTFLAPVTKRAARYVQQLLPGCDLSFDEELGLAAVTRLGIDEPCSGLSRGTQEQLAILTRLAFADLLLEDGAPISLILDDPLVYSDDGRLETMTDILEEASNRMQVILLTCRSKAFRHVDATRIMLK